MKNFIAAIAVAFSAIAATASTVYVGKENAADDAGHGASPELPYASIQYAVDQLGVGGGTVSVAPGTYATDPLADSCWTIYVTNAISVVGATGNPEDVVIKPLTLNSRYRSRVLYLGHPEARLQYVTVAEGFTRDNNGQGGCNVQIGSEGGIVEDCIIRDASGGHWGSAGLGLSMNAGRVSRCVFRNNSSTRSQSVKGAALYASDGLVEDCLFTGSSCQIAATVCIQAPARMVNCTIAGNTGTQRSGVWTLSHPNYGHIIPRVVNCAIFGNTVTSDDTGHAHVWDGKDGSFYSCASELDSFGAQAQGNLLSANPFFKDAVSGNFRISASSDLLDAGCDPSPYLAVGDEVSTTDLDGHPRVVGVVDIGCYENQKNEVECGISVSAEAYVLPATVTLTALPSGVSGTANYSWSLSNEVTEAVETVLAGTETVAQWSAQNAGTYSVYLTLTDSNGSHEFSLLHAIKLSPRDLYVDAGSESPAFPYDTPAKAAVSVHDAVAAAYDGAIVHVASGEYVQNAVLNVTDAIAIVGDDPTNPGGTVLRNILGATYDNNKGRVIYLNNADASICNLSLANGNVDNFAGACLMVDAHGGSVSNCVIYGGRASNHSVSGIGVSMAAGLLSHCIISNCTKVKTYDIDSCAVAVRAAGSSRVSNCLITKNSLSNIQDVEEYGGVMVSVDGAGAVVENCTIVGNALRSKNAALRVSNASAIARNCVIAGNFQPNGVDVAQAWTNASVTADVFVNCAADAESPINSTCLVAPASKLFGNLSLGDYAPSASSPLRNKGASPLLSPAVDLAGNPRVFGQAIDIGCYECQQDPGIVIIYR